MLFIVKNEYKNGKLFLFGCSGVIAVVIKDNKMIIYGGFVVEGCFGFNVGEMFVFDLDKMKFSYLMMSGFILVCCNKYFVVFDNENCMWMWGGSVWDYIGGSLMYVFMVMYYVDVSNFKFIVWYCVEMKGKLLS